MIYLYIKTHNKTGKKYFGQTSKDPLSYRGSGIAWLAHLSRFGNDVSTEILGSFSNREDCKQFARQFSADNDIANSDEWMNLIPETLGGGVADGIKARNTLFEKYGQDYYQRIARKKSPEVLEQARQKLLGNEKCAAGGKKNLGKVREIVICPHCKKAGAKNVMFRWHFDKCKNNGPLV